MFLLFLFFGALAQMKNKLTFIIMNVFAQPGNKETAYVILVKLNNQDPWFP